MGRACPGSGCDLVKASGLRELLANKSVNPLGCLQSGCQKPSIYMLLWLTSHQPYVHTTWFPIEELVAQPAGPRINLKKPCHGGGSPPTLLSGTVPVINIFCIRIHSIPNHVNPPKSALPPGI